MKGQVTIKKNEVDFHASIYNNMLHFLESKLLEGMESMIQYRDGACGVWEDNYYLFSTNLCMVQYF